MRKYLKPECSNDPTMFSKVFFHLALKSRDCVVNGSTFNYSIFLTENMRYIGIDNLKRSIFFLKGNKKGERINFCIAENVSGK